MVITQYPTILPTTEQCPTGLVNNVDDVLVAQVNPPHAEILAICKELGTLPKGAFTDVKTRLDQYSAWLDQSVKVASSPTVKKITISDGQIVFPATAVPSANSNTLDWYKWGNWDLLASDAVTGGNQSTAGSGKYLKVGRLVFVVGNISNVDTSAMTAGNVFYIQGLPFTVGSISCQGSVRLDNITYASENYVLAEALDGEKSVRFIEMNSGGSDIALTVASINDGAGDFWFSITYISAS